MPKTKNVPMRMCVVCRKMTPKENLIRIVRTSDNKIVFGNDKHTEGRGAYVCSNPECIEKCIKKKTLNYVFKTEISDEIYEKLADYANKQSV